MKIQTQKELKIKLKGVDADNFKSIIDKLSHEKSKIGFSQSHFSDKEDKLIKALKEKLNE